MEPPVADSKMIDSTQLVRDVNCHLICSVCRGYLIDATTITECLHSFCRSCVVPHVTEFHTCPSCSVPLSSTKPFSQLRRDYTLQNIVYKMVPRLARSELERRQCFRKERSKTTAIKSSDIKSDERYLQSFFAPDDPISLSLEYAEPNCGFGLRQRITADDSAGSSQQHRRYFKCPAALPLSNLIKFLRAKYSVIDPSTHKLEILYNGHPLAPEYKLSDVAYIFSWKEREPLRLWYRITPSVSEKEEEPIQRKIKLPEEVKKRATLVDITSKRSWESNGKEERRKRRKKLDKKVAPKTIFDESRPAEFSCSTPIPGSAPSDSDPTKIQNWLPKAVFDLDDRALLAKRLQKITTPSQKESVKIEKEEESGSLNPLRICVTPEPDVHDSIGALDLSGSNKDSSADMSSPAGSCRSTVSPVSSKIGPHPYFMTPSAVFHHVQQQDPAQSMATLAAVAKQSRKKSSSSESWDLFQYARPTSAHSQAASHQSLLSLFKTNTLFKATNNKTLSAPNSI